MTDKQRVKEAERLLRQFKENSKLALKGLWDRGDEGFEAQIQSVDKYFNKVNSHETPARLKQAKLDI